MQQAAGPSALRPPPAPAAMQLYSSPARAAFGLAGPSWRRVPTLKGPCCLHGRVGPAGRRRSQTQTQAQATTGVSSSSAKAKGLQNKHKEIASRIPKLPEKPRDINDHAISEVHGTDLQQRVDHVRAMLRSMNDGDISISAYDTAWVALVPRLDGGEGPQFGSTLRWIVDNQLPDGSWGDEALFSAYDRMTNTLACVIALTKWSLEPAKQKKGLDYLHQNIWKLAEEDPESMPIGFEIAFPSLIEAARTLGIDFPYDHHSLQGIYANREVKLKRIPKDMMHIIPTSILHSLEGMPGLDWKKLLKLQSSDGSFLYSPSATAYALIQTGDKRCFEYIDRIVKKFDGGVPNVYPVDLFEHIWVVDRLERLGISRYFEREIEQCMDYVNRHWTEEGICWARNSNVKDVDDTAMAFRLLRLHGYNVSPSVFNNFEKDGEFFCFVGQSNQAVTGMYNLNRASQISFSGEDVLRRARIFSYEFLRQRESQGMLRDKWIISKDLPGEVQYTLEFPWYASLPRVEARAYLDQYGGSDDVWIGKTLYRMPLVNNNEYLELAKHDFNRCQDLHQLEWHGLQKWFIDNSLETFGVALEDVLRVYFLAAACIFEPSRATERLAWTRVSVLANAISRYLHRNMSDMKRIIHFMCNRLYEENVDVPWHKGDAKEEILVKALHRLINSLAGEALPIHQGSKYIQNLLRSDWIQWIIQQINIQNQICGNLNMSPLSCMVLDKQTCILLAQNIEISAGRIGEIEYMKSNSNGARFVQLASSVCDRLHHMILHPQASEKNMAIISHIDMEIELNMQELSQHLLQRSDDRSSNKTKQMFLNVVKSCYYASTCTLDMVDKHVLKVLFEPVI